MLKKLPESVKSLRPAFSSGAPNFFQGGKHGRSVGPYMEIFGGAWLGVQRHCITANDEILNVLFVEKG